MFCLFHLPSSYKLVVLQGYFNNVSEYLRIGPPLYFVVKNYNYRYVGVVMFCLISISVFEFSVFHLLYAHMHACIRGLFYLYASHSQATTWINFWNDDMILFSQLLYVVTILFAISQWYQLPLGPCIMFLIHSLECKLKLKSYTWHKLL